MHDQPLLLPCPFCRQTPNLYVWNDERGAFVQCENPDCGVQPYTDGATVEIVVECWNRRIAAPDDPPVPDVVLGAINAIIDGGFEGALDASDDAVILVRRWIDQQIQRRKEARS